MKTLGLALLVLGLLGLGLGVAMNIGTFTEIAESTEAVPEELASGIQTSTVVAGAGGLAALLGLLLLVFGGRGKQKKR